MKAQAVIELYSNAKKIVTQADGTVAAYDSNNNPITINLTSLATKETELLAADKLDQLRKKRDELLSATDWWMFSDTNTATQAQLDYRQALRDITNTYSSLDDVVWPEKP